MSAYLQVNQKHDFTSTLSVTGITRHKQHRKTVQIILINNEELHTRFALSLSRLNVRSSFPRKYSTSAPFFTQKKINPFEYK